MEGQSGSGRGLYLLEGDNQSSGLSEKSDDPEEQQAGNPCSGPDPSGARRGGAECGAASIPSLRL